MSERERPPVSPQPPMIPGEPFVLDFEWEVTVEGHGPRIIILEVKGTPGYDDLRLGFLPDQAKALVEALNNASPND